MVLKADNIVRIGTRFSHISIYSSSAHNEGIDLFTFKRMDYVIH